MAQDQFAAAVDDSHLLLAFLSRRSLSMDERDRAQFKLYAEALARVQTQVAAKTEVSEADRAAFWDSFIWLSNLASPATIESIRYYFNYYYHRRDPIWVALWQAVVRPRQRAKSGGRWVFSAFTIVTFLATMFLSLAGFVGNRALEQFSKDYRHWYKVAMITRALSYGYGIEAQLDANEHDVTLYFQPPATGTAGAGFRVAELMSDRPGAAPAASRVPVPGVSALNVLHIPEDRVLQLQSAFPQIFSPGGMIKRLDDWVWSPACLQAAAAGSDRSPMAPCVRVGDVILAEELTATLSGMNTERTILEWLLTPVSWLDPRVWHAGAVAGLASAEARPVPVAVAVADGPRGGTAEDRCPGLPVRMPDASAQRVMAQDLHTMNRVFLTILCRRLPMPTVLPPPLQNMLDMPFRAQLSLDVLNTYVLALMFGLLGASVHVMRDIHRRLDDFTLTRVLLSRYKTRLILGAVAGPFIGLFVNPLEGVTSSLNATPQLVNHLTGLGLAFLAGFSVEVLFAALDRFTSVLSAITPASSGSAAVAPVQRAATGLH
jgi:hypothetical protein